MKKNEILYLLGRAEETKISSYLFWEIKKILILKVDHQWYYQNLSKDCPISHWLSKLTTKWSLQELIEINFDELINLVKKIYKIKSRKEKESQDQETLFD